MVGKLLQQRQHCVVELLPRSGIVNNEGAQDAVSDPDRRTSNTGQFVRVQDSQPFLPAIVVSNFLRLSCPQDFPSEPCVLPYSLILQIQRQPGRCCQSEVFTCGIQ